MSDTEITQSISSENPANNDSLEGLNDFFKDKLYLHLEKVIPGIVESYNKTTNRAVIKPAIMGETTQGEKVSKDFLSNIPVLQLGSKYGIITFPIKAGMTGWLIASDRDISIFKSIKQETAPNTTRKHKYQDSFFIPDSINSTGTDNLTISTEETSFIFGKSFYKINASSIEITGDISQTGTISQTGSITSTVSISAPTLNATNAFSGTFKDNDNKTVTVVNGIITAVSL